MTRILRKGYSVPQTFHELKITNCDSSRFFESIFSFEAKRDVPSELREVTALVRLHLRREILQLCQNNTIFGKITLREIP